MLRKLFIIAVGLGIGYLLGAIIGFNKGIEYQQDKKTKELTEDIFTETDDSAHINLTLNSE
jgi:hypothetical protein